MLVKLKKLNRLVLNKDALFKYAEKFLKTNILDICLEIINLKFCI